MRSRQVRTGLIARRLDVHDNTPVTHEADELGYSASGCAANALDNLLKTNHTRIKFADGLCTMQPEPVDFELLKAEAMEFYRNL